MSTSKPKVSVITPMLDAAEDHVNAIEAAAVQVARAANGVLMSLRSLDTALATIRSHGENAQAVLDEIRALRPTISGRRTDLGAIA